MKILVKTTFDSETGEYEIKFENLSNPGESMDYHLIKDMLQKIHGDFGKQLNGDVDLPDGAYDVLN